MHLIDLTERYGVYIGVFLGFRTNDRPTAAARPDLVPLTSMLRKEPGRRDGGG
jgi:hypothetical protein